MSKKMTVKTKKITVYLFSVALTISLIAGYFCFMPQMAQAESISAIMPDMSFSDCQEMPTINHYILSSATPSHAIAPCCLEKNDHNSQTDAISLGSFSFNNINCQSVSMAQIANNDSANYAVSFDYPISPSQTELLSSVIIRD